VFWHYPRRAPDPETAFLRTCSGIVHPGWLWLMLLQGLPLHC